ncbi:uncharacterized protein LOC141612137 [Silene latifolia]|uniref:uncharacterized protein LOC141612134 n=1 Tax=Silene latifolia TaxID=37657 RepID=UPI003D788C2D
MAFPKPTFAMDLLSATTLADQLEVCKSHLDSRFYIGFILESPNDLNFSAAISVACAFYASDVNKSDLFDTFVLKMNDHINGNRSGSRKDVIDSIFEISKDLELLFVCYLYSFNVFGMESSVLLETYVEKLPLGVKTVRTCESIFLPRLLLCPIVKCSVADFSKVVHLTSSLIYTEITSHNWGCAINDILKFRKSAPINVASVLYCLTRIANSLEDSGIRQSMAFFFKEIVNLALSGTGVLEAVQVLGDIVSSGDFVSRYYISQLAKMSRKFSQMPENWQMQVRDLVLDPALLSKATQDALPHVPEDVEKLFIMNGYSLDSEIQESPRRGMQGSFREDPGANSSKS